VAERKPKPLSAKSLRKAALARYKVVYPQCVDPYIRVAFVTGWVESAYAAAMVPEKKAKSR